jgi:hypothetical protein
MIILVFVLAASLNLDLPHESKQVGPQRRGPTDRREAKSGDNARRFLASWRCF